MSKHYQLNRVTQLKQLAHKFNRDGFEPELRNVLSRLAYVWLDGAAYVAFKRQLERTKITRRCKDLGPNFRGGWQ